jgi:hypothetical protein
VGVSDGPDRQGSQSRTRRHCGGACAINANNVRLESPVRSLAVVSLQHEYGIWGGHDGAYVLDFVRAVRTPVVATLHTVLERPTVSQRQILSELVRATAATVVMSNAAARLLSRTHGVDPTSVAIIPHGVPDLPLQHSHARGS